MIISGKRRVAFINVTTVKATLPFYRLFTIKIASSVK